MAQRLSARGRERRIARQHQRRVVARGADQLTVRLDAGDAEAGHTGLPRAKNVAFPAQPEIFLGDAKAVLGLAHDVEPGLGGFTQRSLVEEEAGRVLAAAPDPPAQLMELREPEAFGMLDHHTRRRRPRSRWWRRGAASRPLRSAPWRGLSRRLSCGRARDRPWRRSAA